jgi:hypothetical protein
MNRQEIVTFCNREIFSQIPITVEIGVSGMVETIKAVSRWRIGKKIDAPMTAKVDDGVLYINGEFVTRICGKYERVRLTEKGEYYEGRILARQELAYAD